MKKVLNLWFDTRKNKTPEINKWAADRLLAGTNKDEISFNCTLEKPKTILPSMRKLRVTLETISIKKKGN